MTDQEKTEQAVEKIRDVLSELNDGAHIVQLAVAYESVDLSSGEIESSISFTISSMPPYQARGLFLEAADGVSGR